MSDNSFDKTDSPNIDTAEAANLRDHFLIAMPSLSGSFFDHTLTYICEHNEEGAMGIVINTPLKDINLQEIMQQMQLTCPSNICEQAILSGGPVQIERGFVLHANSEKFQYESTLAVSPQVCLTSSKDIMQAIADGCGPEQTLMTLGYAGWGAGQLENEILENAWLTAPADPNIIFNTAAEARWHSAAQQLGIDPNLLSREAGHA